MSPEGSLAPKLLKRGSLLHIPAKDLKFSSDKNSGKFVILMEDFDSDNEKDTVVLILGTSNLKFKNKKSVVFVPKNTIKELALKDGLFDCNNYYELTKSKILQKRCRFLCYLSKSVMNKVNEALKFTNKIPIDLMLRIKP